MSATAPAFVVLVFAVGASLGSFVNVVAHRVPQRLSLVKPASRCPSCGTPIKWHDNVPVFGWLWLRGRCRACGVAISARYPLVELALGLVAVALWMAWAHALGASPLTTERFVAGLVVPFTLQLALASGLVALALIDLDWFLLPDVITLPLALLGLMASLAIGKQTGVDLPAASLGALVGFGVPLAVGLIYALVTGRVGLGGGDWKLLGAVGAWLGMPAALFVLFAGALHGLLAAIVFRRDFARAAPPLLPGEVPEPEAIQPEGASVAETRFGRLHVPFGPFLVVAAFEWLLFGRELAHVLGPFFGVRP